MSKYPAFKGAGQRLKIFEEEVTYRIRKDIDRESDIGESAIDDYGYVTRVVDEEDEDYEFENVTIKAAIVEDPEEDYDVDRVGESVIGVGHIYVRRKQYEMCSDVEVPKPNVGDFIITKDDVKWKILNVSDYETYVKCTAGRLEGDSAYVG